MFESTQTAVIKYCAEEVKRQQAGPLEVYWMLDAWNYAAEYEGDLTVDFVVEVARRVEPGDNARGLRRVPVYVGNYVATPVPEVRGKLQTLCEQWEDTDMAPEEWYREFQLIHPFVDGNGRTGKIVMNWLMGDMEDPQMPPNFFNVSNP